MNSIRASLSVLFVALASLHCSSTTSNPAPGPSGSSGSSGSSGDSSTPDATRTGITPCGSFPDRVAKTCQAGQNCADERLSECDEGCLTDNNCPATATCSLDTTIGVCRTAAPPVTAVSCDALCKKIQACRPETTTAECARVCAGFNEACKTCLLNANCTASSSACDTECK